MGTGGERLHEVLEGYDRVPASWPAEAAASRTGSEMLLLRYYPIFLSNGVPRRTQCLLCHIFPFQLDQLAEGSGSLGGFTAPPHFGHTNWCCC